MAVRYDRGDVKQTTTGFRGPLMVQSLTSAKSKFLSLDAEHHQSIVYFNRSKGPYNNNFLFLHQERLHDGEYSALLDKKPLT